MAICLNIKGQQQSGEITELSWVTLYHNSDHYTTKSPVNHKVPRERLLDWANHSLFFFVMWCQITISHWNLKSSGCNVMNSGSNGIWKRWCPMLLQILKVSLPMMLIEAGINWMSLIYIHFWTWELHLQVYLLMLQLQFLGSLWNMKNATALCMYSCSKWSLTSPRWNAEGSCFKLWTCGFSASVTPWWWCHCRP